MAIRERGDTAAKEVVRWRHGKTGIKLKCWRRLGAKRWRREKEREGGKRKKIERRKREEEEEGTERKGIRRRSMEGGTRRNLVVEKSKIDHVVAYTQRARTRIQVLRKERGKR